MKTRSGRHAVAAALALAVEPAAWGIKRMKTMWGACNPDARRIWLNLELAKKPPECIEYIVLHELGHERWTA